MLRHLFFGSSETRASPSIMDEEREVLGKWRPVPPSTIGIFLDFDGVMHRADNGSLERMPELSLLLEAIPDALIILSTNWRLNASREYLLGLFPKNLRHRIAGANPDFSDGLPAQRERECLAFARSAGITRFIAIDDDPDWFSPHCKFLVLTDRYVGLDAEVMATCVRNCVQFRLTG